MIAVFAGTQEGREVLERLKTLNLPIFGSTATSYGCELIKNYEKLELNASPMNQSEMESWLKEKKIQVVIDATHPYAHEVTANIAKVCQGLQLPLARLKRSWVPLDSVKRFENYEDCISYLQKGTGKILLTTGSNNLEKFTESLPKERLIARVLPRANVLEKCEKIGLKANQILAIQGPFSHEMNQAMMKDFQISQMVTKESGTIGGFQEKLQAAQKMNVEVLSIMKKSEETSFSTESQDELLNWVQDQIQGMEN